MLLVPVLPGWGPQTHAGEQDADIWAAIKTQELSETRQLQWLYQPQYSCPGSNGYVKDCKRTKWCRSSAEAKVNTDAPAEAKTHTEDERNLSRKRMGATGTGIVRGFWMFWTFRSFEDFKDIIRYLNLNDF